MKIWLKNQFDPDSWVFFAQRIIIKQLTPVKGTDGYPHMPILRPLAARRFAGRFWATGTAKSSKVPQMDDSLSRTPMNHRVFKFTLKFRFTNIRWVRRHVSVTHRDNIMSVRQLVNLPRLNEIIVKRKQKFMDRLLQLDLFLLYLVCIVFHFSLWFVFISQYVFIFLYFCYSFCVCTLFHAFDVILLCIIINK